MLRAIGLGDFLTGVPAYRAVRAARPNAEIWLAAPEPLRPLADLCGAVDVLLPTPDLGQLPRLDWRPRLAVNLHGVGPESTGELERTRPDRLITHSEHGVRDGDQLPWNSDQHEVLRWCRLLDNAGIPADPDDLRLRRPAVTAPVADAVVIHPGAASGSRRWPIERFAAVGADLVRRGRRVVITGNQGERAAATWLAGELGLPGEQLLAGRLQLDELAALVASARLVVCGDTGVGHLATAYGTPSVLLFGPTPPAYWGPRSGPHRVLWTGSGTSPVGDPHAQDVDPRLLEIGVPEVVDAVRQMERARPHPR